MDENFKDPTSDEVESILQQYRNEHNMPQPNVADSSTISDDLSDVQNAIDDYRKYGNRNLETFLGSAASSASFGLSDQALTRLGIYTKDELKKIREENPTADVTGQAAGILVPGIGELAGLGKAAKISGTLVEGAAKAGEGVEKLTEKLVSKAISESGSKKLSREIIKKSLAKGAGSAVEGAAYGAGQLLREDAMGEADLNAENLLSHIGGGALIGGGLGAGIGVISPVIKATTEGASSAAGKFAKKYLNPEKDTKDFLGITDREVLKNPNIVQESKDYIINKLNFNKNDDLQSLVQKNALAQESAVQKLDEVYGAVGANNIPKTVFKDAADKIQSEFIDGKEGLKSFQSLIRPAKNIKEDLLKLSNSTKEITLKELRELRQNFDKMSKSYYKSLDPTEAAEAAYRTRSILSDNLNKAVAEVRPDLAPILADANKTYSMSKKLEPILEKKALKEPDLFQWKDLLLGGIYSHIGNGAGLLLPLGEKFLKSDLKKKLVILSNIEKANGMAEKTINSAVENFLKPAGKISKRVAVYSLAQSPIAFSQSGKPKNKNEAYENAVERLNNFRTDPVKFSDEMNKDLYHIEQAAPKTAEVLANRSVDVLNFLDSKIPRGTQNLMLDKPFTKPYKPSSLELAKFERYVQVIDKPLSVLGELEKGTITREHVEALKTIYPNLYGRIRTKVLNSVKQDDKLSYSKKVQLGILFDSATDESLVPENILALQASFAPQAQNGNQPVNQTVGGAKNISIADRQTSGVENVLLRKS